MSSICEDVCNAEESEPMAVDSEVGELVTKHSIEAGHIWSAVLLEVPSWRFHEEIFSHSLIVQELLL